MASCEATLTSIRRARAAATKAAGISMYYLPELPLKPEPQPIAVKPQIECPVCDEYLKHSWRLGFWTGVGLSALSFLIAYTLVLLYVFTH